MPEKLKNLLIRFLFKLLDVGSGKEDEGDKEIVKWMEWSSRDIGFIRYCQSRERRLIREMVADGMLPMPRESFVRKAGQRFELHALMQKVGMVQRDQDRKKAVKEREAEKKQRHSI